MFKRIVRYVIVLSFLFVLLSSCYRPPAVHIPQTTPGLPGSIANVNVYFVDNGLMFLKDRAIVLNGLDAWSKATRGAVKWNVLHDFDSVEKSVINGDCNNITVIVMYVTSFDPRIVDQSSEINTIGLCMQYSCKYSKILLVTDRLYNDALIKTTSTHEFGHMFGVDHIPDPKSIMSAIQTDQTAGCLTKNDLSAFCEVRSCNVEDLVYCEP